MTIDDIKGPSMKITVTGADTKTSLKKLAQLVLDFPTVEIGLLYTATPEGRNRYPDIGWLRDAVSAVAGRCALHVCGRSARNQLIAGGLSDLIAQVTRVQVNGIVAEHELFELAMAVPILITQHCLLNEHLVDIDVSNHQLLVDGSGGRGISPAIWTRPNTAKATGFAGGLGGDNLIIELKKISMVSSGNWWVDMEGKLRTNDWFDIDAARSVIRQFHNFIDFFNHAKT